MSTAGGLNTAFDRAVDTGCDVMQVFVKNQRQWRAKPLDDEAIAAWNAARDRTGIRTIVAHDAYLINLAAPQDAVWKTSIDAFLDEVTRCRQTGIRWLVTHPGSHNGTGEDAGIKRVAQAMDIIHDRIGDCGVTTLLEMTAGQGTNLGYRFEHLRDIIAATRSGPSLGICLDTCHLFAAGYDLTTDAGYGQMTDALVAAVGTQAVRCIHMNDSKKPLGSRVDRHEHIGKGQIGRMAFSRLINDTRFFGVPMILETPKEKDARGRDMDRVNLAMLRKMIGKQLDR
jgi:deoxyribonuclease-4